MKKGTITKRIERGMTLVELVVTLALIGIITAMTSSFLYFYININSRIDTYRRTTDNANTTNYVISTWIDQRNDGRLSEPSEEEKASGVIIKYQGSDASSSLSYDSTTHEIKTQSEVFYSSLDETMSISTTWTSVKNSTKSLVKFTISYQDGEDISFLKLIY